jgi:hypothetical protein
MNIKLQKLASEDLSTNGIIYGMLIHKNYLLVKTSNFLRVFKIDLLNNKISSLCEIYRNGNGIAKTIHGQEYFVFVALASSSYLICDFFNLETGKHVTKCATFDQKIKPNISTCVVGHEIISNNIYQWLFDDTILCFNIEPETLNLKFQKSFKIVNHTPFNTRYWSHISESHSRTLRSIGIGSLEGINISTFPLKQNHTPNTTYFTISKSIRKVILSENRRKLLCIQKELLEDVQSPFLQLYCLTNNSWVEKGRAYPLTNPYAPIDFFQNGFIFYAGYIWICDLNGNTITNIPVTEVPQDLSFFKSRYLITVSNAVESESLELNLYKFSTWENYDRFLWIAKMKNDPECCPFAKLPREIIKEILSFVSPF